MSRAGLFLALALAGLAVQAAVLGIFFGDEGLDLGQLGDQAVGTKIAVLSLVDLAFSAVAYLLWLPGEAARSGIRPWWPYAVAVLGGVCFALPLFLGARERVRERAA